MVLIGSAVAGIIVLLGLMVHDISAVYTSANFARANTVPSIQALNEAESQIAEMRIMSWQHVSSTDASATTRIEASIASAHATLLKTLNDYQASLLVDDQDGADLRADREALNEYRALREKVIQLSRAGKKDEARELIFGSLAVIGRLTGAIDAHAKYNMELGVKGAKEAEKTRRNALIVSCTIGLGLLSALLLTGWQTLGWLKRTLGGEPAEVATVAHSVASGNLSRNVM